MRAKSETSITGFAATTRWLIEDFSRGDIFFASPNTQWRSRFDQGVLATVKSASSATVQSLFEHAHQKHIDKPVLFGLIPFDTRQAASFTVPMTYECADIPKKSTNPSKTYPRKESDSKILERTFVPQPEAYADMVRDALTLIDKGTLQKIVLARAVDIELNQPPEYSQLLQDLLHRNPHGYTFALPIWAENNKTKAIMIGASPELLVRREGDRISVNPLAGSRSRSSNQEFDLVLKENLTHSEKDLREHAYVVSSIKRILQAFCDELDVPLTPSVIGTDTLWHLSTFIRGRLRDPNVCALQVACALHPTPAICGHPTAPAFEHIRHLEPFEREYFAGLVGWQRPNGDGEWALTLRCAMQTHPSLLRVYAGAGIVAGSNPNNEITETSTKMETFNRALV
ncbi:isochorismate synthase [Orrella sp. 11846]|uniref:isochorismate synthase n=1 Tax=Orrella sp. 11846 TaxID=3409913 RepID=UPI003B5954F6